jgi:hypothetical protein
MQRAWGWGQLGSQVVRTLGISSSTKVQQTFASCTVTVYVSGTLNLATIYSDNLLTPLANPFTADATGAWAFYAANGRYDVSLSGGGIIGTITYPDLLLSDFGASGAIASINALTAAAQTIVVGTGGSDFNIVSSGSVHTLNLPTASASKRGLLASADWSTFNGKQAPISVSAPVTLAANVIGLAIPLTILQGGTGQVTAAAAFSALSPLTTKGDLLVYGSASARLPAGTNGQILSADSTQALGVKWITDPYSSLTIPLTVANGGTGLVAGTSGGIPAYTGATTLVSSALLVAGNPVLGGGAGAAPSTTGPATSYNGQILAGNGLVTAVFSSQVQTNSTTTQTAQILLTAPPAGNYLVTYYLFTGSVSDGTATARINFGWTDSVGAKTLGTQPAALALAAAANQSNSYLVPIASGNLTYTLTYVAGAGGNYNLLIVVVRL